MFKQWRNWHSGVWGIVVVYGCAGSSADPPEPEISPTVNPACTTVWYEDNDRDGYGNSRHTQNACDLPDGFVGIGGDCDDTNASASPAAIETCNDINDDCDTEIDEGCASPTPCELMWYFDFDGDGFGNSNQAVVSCDAPSDQYVLANGDCVDTAATIFPGNEDGCEDPGADNDCDGHIDEDCITPTPCGFWYLDTDLDGFGEESSVVESCQSPGDVYITVGGDCDDTNALVNPNADEQCNVQDDNCNGDVDEDCGEISPTPCEVLWYPDHDKDDYGNDAGVIESCESPGDGYVITGGDCDDTDATIHPTAVEACDETDDDCDGIVDEDCGRSCNDPPCPGRYSGIGTIEVYEWLGEQYYLYYYRQGDGMNDLYSLDCSYVCAPTGGFTGYGDGLCPTFIQEATLEATLCEGWL